MPRSYATPPVRDLLRRYASLGEPLACEPVAQGLLNRGYRLATTRGEYFLKHHLDGDHQAIARQHDATRRLQTLGVPVAPPVPDDDGDTVTVLGGRCYALHPWIHGRHRDGAQLGAVGSRRLGALLGLVHTCLEEIMEGRTPGTQADPRTAAQPESRTGAQRGAQPRTHAGVHIPAQAHTSTHTQTIAPMDARTGAPADAGPATHASADPADTFALIDDLLARTRRRRPRDSFDELAEHRLRERRVLIEEHAHRRPPAQPAGGWVHGDFHPLNLLYQGKEPAAIVDWDRLGVQPRAEEAVRAAVIFFVRPAGELELDKVRAYARAYRLATGADPAELAAAVHRVWWERLNDFWILRWRYQLHDRRADPQFPAASALAVWWTSEYEAVCEAFAG
ncbi:phosphotransferase [Streptomyces sp. NPDC020719]|uniref:phosphotransferase n=1 Tax=unclassified Streptomyces TaxID=2593676 RepID=UPI0033F4D7E0